MLLWALIRRHWQLNSLCSNAFLPQVPLCLLLAVPDSLGRITLRPEVRPFSEILGALAPLQKQPAGVEHPNGRVAVVAHTLVLFGDEEVVAPAHDALAEVADVGKVDQLAERRQLRAGGVVGAVLPRRDRGAHLQHRQRPRAGIGDGTLGDHEAVLLGQFFRGQRRRPGRPRSRPGQIGAAGHLDPSQHLQLRRAVDAARSGKVTMPLVGSDEPM